jgi:histidine triad (HIT) family protein
MEHSSCIFCNIISGSIPVPFLHETKDLVVIKDKFPKAPIHYLIIPKKHLANIQELENSDALLAGNMMLMARDLSKQLTGSQDFKFVMNNGEKAGQSVFHMHAHFISGKQLGEI